MSSDFLLRRELDSDDTRDWEELALALALAESETPTAGEEGSVLTKGSVLMGVRWGVTAGVVIGVELELRVGRLDLITCDSYALVFSTSNSSSTKALVSVQKAPHYLVVLVCFCFLNCCISKDKHLSPTIVTVPVDVETKSQKTLRQSCTYMYKF